MMPAEKPRSGVAMPVHPYEVAVVVEMTVKGALECPPDCLADPYRQLNVGRVHDDPVTALLDIDDAIERALALLALRLLTRGADQHRPVRPHESPVQGHDAGGKVVIAAMACLADHLMSGVRSRSPAPAAGVVDGMALRTDGGRQQLSGVLVGIDPACALSQTPMAPPLGRHHLYRRLISRHEGSPVGRGGVGGGRLAPPLCQQLRGRLDRVLEWRGVRPLRGLLRWLIHNVLEWRGVWHLRGLHRLMDRLRDRGLARVGNDRLGLRVVLVHRVTLYFP